MMKVNLALLLLVVNIAYPMSKELSKTELSTLNDGEIVVREITDERGPWPIFELIALTDYAPLDGIAVFAAYPYQKQYVPNVIKSNVISESKLGVDVAYELKTPWPLPNSTYTNRHNLIKLGADHYKVSWSQLKASSTKYAEGFAEFRQYDEKTIFVYQTFIHPDSVFAGLVEKTARNDIKSTMQAIIDHTYFLEKRNPKKMGLLKKDILEQIAGKKVYLD